MITEEDVTIVTHAAKKRTHPVFILSISSYRSIDWILNSVCAPPPWHIVKFQGFDCNIKLKFEAEALPESDLRDAYNVLENQCAFSCSKTGKIMLMTENITKGMVKMLKAPNRPSLKVSQLWGTIGR